MKFIWEIRALSWIRNNEYVKDEKSPREDDWTGGFMFPEDESRLNQDNNSERWRLCKGPLRTGGGVRFRSAEHLSCVHYTSDREKSMSKTQVLSWWTLHPTQLGNIRTLFWDSSFPRVLYDFFLLCTLTWTPYPSQVCKDSELITLSIYGISQTPWDSCSAPSDNPARGLRVQLCSSTCCFLRC